jgi:probable F420-dependent oxidoreductase
VSDHLVNPKEQPYPAPYISDPLLTLGFAAAATETIGLGTSVLVATQYPSALVLANTIASLDYLSGGRLVLGVGVGWSQREYEALGAAFDHRGARLDEMLALFRTVWENDPADFEGTYYASLKDIRVLPQPAHRIPIWIGARGDKGIERALRHDGLHAGGGTPEEMKETVERLRERRPDEDFVISIRLAWDLGKMEMQEVADLARAYEPVGIGAVHIAPDRGTIDQWLEMQEGLAKALELSPK